MVTRGWGITLGKKELRRQKIHRIERPTNKTKNDNGSQYVTREKKRDVIGNRPDR